MGRSEVKNGEFRGSRSPNLRAVNARSGVTNGNRLMIRLKAGNRFYLRRLSDLIAIYTSDYGGDDLCSEAEKALIRRAATLTLQTELMEEYWVANADGKASDKSLMIYQRASNALLRILGSLGLRRRAKNVTPTVDQYLEHIGYQRGGPKERADAEAAK
jgi:hypothetical protein